MKVWATPKPTLASQGPILHPRAPKHSSLTSPWPILNPEKNPIQFTRHFQDIINLIIAPAFNWGCSSKYRDPILGWPHVTARTWGTAGLTRRPRNRVVGAHGLLAASFPRLPIRRLWVAKLCKTRVRQHHYRFFTQELRVQLFRLHPFFLQNFLIFPLSFWGSRLRRRAPAVTS